MEQVKTKYIQLSDGTEIISNIDSNDWENSRYIKLYDPLRLYSIPPFMSPNPTEAQTILLIKWLPWTDDAFVTLSIDRISVVTNVTKAMNTFYDDTVQKYNKLESSELEQFNKISLADIGIAVEEEAAENETAESLNELAESFNQLLKKRILH